jgi:hypothetical protein
VAKSSFPWTVITLPKDWQILCDTFDRLAPTPSRLERAQLLPIPIVG